MNDCQEITNAVAIANHGDFPCSLTRWIEVDYDGTHAGYMAAPVAIRFRGSEYGKASHNSDTHRICYRTDKPFAYKV